MTRDTQRENIALRQRLRDTESRLRLLASAVLADDAGAQALARLLLTSPDPARLDLDGVSPWPPSSHSGEPVARSDQHQE
jgi:hypothetical protein